MARRRRKKTKKNNDGMGFLLSGVSHGNGITFKAEPFVQYLGVVNHANQMERAYLTFD